MIDFQEQREPYSNPSVKIVLMRQNSKCRGEFDMAQYQIHVDSEILHQLFLGNVQNTGDLNCLNPY